MESVDEREVNDVESIKEKPGTTSRLDQLQDSLDGKDARTLACLPQSDIHTAKG